MGRTRMTIDAPSAETVALHRLGYIAEHLFDGWWHVSYMGEHGRQCVGTYTSPDKAAAALDRQGWPTGPIPVAFCPECTQALAV